MQQLQKAVRAYAPAQQGPGARTKEGSRCCSEPILNHRGVHSWPPTWTRVAGLDNKYPVREISILRNPPGSNLPTDAFLASTLTKHPIGCLLIDDIAFCRQIV